eukprot:3958004-Lingulodinium_polyedra.AAC.1
MDLSKDEDGLPSWTTGIGAFILQKSKPDSSIYDMVLSARSKMSVSLPLGWHIDEKQVDTMWCIKQNCTE